MRFKAAEDTERTLWLNEITDWTSLNGRTTAVGTSLTWLDDGGPGRC